MLSILVVSLVSQRPCSRCRSLALALGRGQWGHVGRRKSGGKDNTRGPTAPNLQLWDQEDSVGRSGALRSTHQFLLAGCPHNWWRGPVRGCTQLSKLPWAELPALEMNFPLPKLDGLRASHPSPQECGGSHPLPGRLSGLCPGDISRRCIAGISSFFFRPS